ncbi:MAG: hypothetical protein KAJ69_06640, partial [Thermoplasmatales archaeon]|nr:hypothetical protein [Thermoplasmatales archaeon]
MLLTIFFAATTVIADDFETTIVSINPSSQTVSSEGTFNIDVYCNPGQPIKSFEFKLSFDASLLQVNSVTEGDIFDGYVTFFNSGTIDNNAGSIVDVYGLILGSGNISNNGTLVNISITAKSTIGTSSLNLCGVGVTNDTEYVSIAVNNGSAIVRSVDNNPILSSPNPTNGLVNVPISTASLSINIQDPDGDTFNYTISTSPNIGSSSGNESSNGSKSCSISGLDYSTTYTWHVSCKDTGSGNWTNKSYWFTTESNGGDGDGDGNGGGFPSPGSGTNNDTSGQNNPPETPVKPSGPAFVEMGVEYTYMTTTFDRDGDQIRYQFDWGDGTSSSWTDFASSNISVSMSRIWNVISDHHVRVLAQDINGSNSSWSPVTNIVVSQIESIEPSSFLNESVDKDENSMSSSWSPVLSGTVSQVEPREIPSFVDENVDNFEKFIWNSNGNYWESIGTNIQAAVDDLGSNNGIVWLSDNSTFILADEIKIVGKNNITIVGYGTILKHADNFYTTASQTNLLDIQDSNDITIEGIEFHGNGGNQVGYNTTSIKIFGESDRIFLQNLLFRNSKEGDIYIAGNVKTVNLFECLFEDYGSGTTSWSVYMSGGKKLNVFQCQWSNYNTSGTPQCFYLDSATTNTQYSIENSVFENCYICFD